jgi:hypothetical protein
VGLCVNCGNVSINTDLKKTKVVLTDMLCVILGIRTTGCLT